MGRAYEVRKVSIQKTGALKGKLYTTYAKEIYQAAKNGGIDPSSNVALKRLMDKAKKDQVPADIIKRAIDKVSSGATETYVKNVYEFFGPGGSTLITECLTDNVNRTMSDLRTVVNKCHIKMGALGSVSFNYDHLCIVGFKGLSLDDTLELMVEADIDFIDIEEEELILIYAEPSLLYKIKEAVLTKVDNVEVEETTMLAKEKVELNDEDMVIFDKVVSMFNDVDDVSNVYYNVTKGE